MFNDTVSASPEGVSRGIQPIAPPRWRLLGLPVDRVDMDEAARIIVEMIEQGRRDREMRRLVTERNANHPPYHVVTLNPEMVMGARRDAALWRVIQRATLVTPDGIGIVWASRLLGGGLPERVTGVDLIERLAPMLASRGHRLFLLGAGPGIGDEAAQRLLEHAPGLVIVGIHGGSASPDDADTILAAIRQAKPDLLCVAFGSPAQELWIAEHREELDVPVAIGVGGALDFIAGALQRAPRWMRAVGLEWLYRLLRQPWRWKRMLALPRFAVAIGRSWARLRSPIT